MNQYLPPQQPHVNKLSNTYVAEKKQQSTLLEDILQPYMAKSTRSDKSSKIIVL